MTTDYRLSHQRSQPSEEKPEMFPSPDAMRSSKDVQAPGTAPFSRGPANSLGSSPLTFLEASHDGSAGSAVVSQTVWPGQRQSHGGRSLRVWMRGVAVLLIMGVLGIALFVPIHRSLPRQQAGTAPNRTVPPIITSQRSMPPETPTPSSASSLPAGWSTAGLNQGDALFAGQAASIFTQEEINLDYRVAGTHDRHGGTMTAAIALLTPGGVQRFYHNDIRVINNTLFDQLEQQQLIRFVMTPATHLVHVTTMGQQVVVWVDVSFSLWISRLTSAAGQRTEGLELDPKTHTHTVHHLIVLLARVDPQTNPAPSFGWLVSTYELDPPGLPAILQPV